MIFKWINFASIFLMMALFFISYLAGVRSESEQEGKKKFSRATLFLVVASINYLLMLVPLLRISVLPDPDWPVAIAVGLVLGGFAYSIQIMAIRVKKQHAGAGLLTTGVYRFIRHPWAFHEIYCFFMLACIADSSLLILISFLWFPVFAIPLRIEEKMLSEKFGEAYERYKRSSWFLFPNFLLLFKTKAPRSLSH